MALVASWVGVGWGAGDGGEVGLAGVGRGLEGAPPALGCCGAGPVG